VVQVGLRELDRKWEKWVSIIDESPVPRESDVRMLSLVEEIRAAIRIMKNWENPCGQKES
jgi:hypothetical protein